MNSNGPDLHGRHFEEDEIDVLAWQRRNGQSLVVDAAQLEQLNQHLTSCDVCREKVETREEDLAAMAQILASTRRESDADCPPEEIWPLAAAGPAPTAEAMEHVAECSRCATLLRQALADITLDATPEEAAAIASLPSSGPGMPRMIAQRLAAPYLIEKHTQESHAKAARHSGLRVWPRLNWQVALAASLLALVSVAYLWHQQQVNRPEVLLAEAYTAHRTMEWRFREAAHAPLRVTRGGYASQPPSSSPEMLRLEALIAEQMTKHPNDPYWIRQDGRLNLLLWRYDAALADFKRALDLELESVESLTDLAGAYFERAEAAGHDFDYGTAIELLSKALEKRPGDAVTLFNRGLANERMFLYGRAIADWQDLLKAEPKGPWADEAHTRLQEAKKNSTHADVHA